VNQLLSIAVTPANQTIGLAGTQQFAATGTFKNFDGSTSTSNVTSMITTWTSGMTTVATISSSGLATAVAGGTTLISATLFGVTGSTNLTVSGTPVPVSLLVSPATPTIAIGNALTFTAQEVWSDGSKHTPAAGTVTWSSDTTTAATVISTPTSGISLGAGAGTANITATEGTLTPGSTKLTVVTGTTHFAYISNNLGNTIQWYTANATTSPYLTSAGTFSHGGPRQSILHPNGQYLYEPDDTGGVLLLAVNPTTGALTVPAGISEPQAVVGTGTDALNGVVEPYGRFLYVADGGNGTTAGAIDAFQISATDGSLTRITGAPFTTNVNVPQQVLIDHAGAFLYAINQNNNTVSAYAITQTGATAGALTPVAGQTPIATGTTPQYATLDPSGTHLYVANVGNNTVSAYTVAAGVLTQIGTTNTSIGTAVAVFNVAVDPSGKYLYVLDAGSTATPTSNGQVFSLSITAGTGAIGTVIGSAAATGLGPTGISVDPTGVLICVDNNADGPPGTITPITISAGALTAKTAVAAGSSPYFVVFYNAP
jgi:YVTN family beta-propeller protein